MRNMSNLDFNFNDIDFIKEEQKESSDFGNKLFECYISDEEIMDFQKESKSNSDGVGEEIDDFRDPFTVLESGIDLINTSKKVIETFLPFFEKYPGEVEAEIKYNFWTSYSVLKFSNEYYVVTHHSLKMGLEEDVQHGALFSVNNDNPLFLGYVVVKTIEQFNHEGIDNVEKEKRLMVKAHSSFSFDIIDQLPVIEKIFSFDAARTNYCFIQPLLPGEILSNIIAQGKISDETKLYTIIVSVIEEVRRIHAMHIIHGCISPWTILCDEENDHRAYLVNFKKSGESSINEVFAFRNSHYFEMDSGLKIDRKFTAEQGKAVEIGALAFLINELFNSYYSLDDSRLKTVRDYLQTMIDSDLTKRPSIDKIRLFFTHQKEILQASPAVAHATSTETTTTTSVSAIGGCTASLLSGVGVFSKTETSRSVDEVANEMELGIRKANESKSNKCNIL